jgi:nitronate monooxygenase
LLPYPAQYSVSRDLRKAAAERGDGAFIAMWAGQGVGLIRKRAAADLVNDLVVESQRLLGRLVQG